MAARPAGTTYPSPQPNNRPSFPLCITPQGTLLANEIYNAMLPSLLTSQIVHSRGNPLWLPCGRRLPHPGGLLYTNLAPDPSIVGAIPCGCPAPAVALPWARRATPQALESVPPR